MKTLSASLGVVLLALASAPVHSGEKGDKLTAKELVGDYTIVSGERGGKALPKEEIEGSIIHFTADTIMAVDKDKKHIYGATYKIDEGKEPVHIHMVSVQPKKGEAADGLLKLHGGHLHLVYALPSGKAPDDFKTGPHQQAFVLKKLKK